MLSFPPASPSEPGSVLLLPFPGQHSLLCWASSHSRRWACSWIPPVLSLTLKPWNSIAPGSGERKPIPGGEGGGISSKWACAGGKCSQSQLPGEQGSSAVLEVWDPQGWWENNLSAQLTGRQGVWDVQLLSFQPGTITLHLIQPPWEGSYSLANHGRNRKPGREQNWV